MQNTVGLSAATCLHDRYIERKGIIFDQIAEKGDVDQATRLQKENRNLMEKMEMLEREYHEVRNALEFIIPLIEDMDTNDLKEKVFEKMKKELSVPTGPPTRGLNYRYFQ